ncbi:MAG: T9SS type A sorting domain-containing protein [bacterium]
MRTAVRGLLAALILGLLAVPVLGQIPTDGTFTVYFDEGWTQRAIDCPGPVFDTLYVVAEDWDNFVVGAQFKIDLPPSMVWLADLGTPPTTIGSSPTGISIAWPIPMNGFFPFEVMKVLVMWTCSDCSTVNQLITVEEHPLFGGINSVQFPSYELLDGAGRGSAVCPYAALDIKPRSCPNPFNAHLFDWAEDDSKPMKGGVLPVAVLGSETFDVTDVDLESLRLEGVAPLTQGGGPKIIDVAGPVVDPMECECTTAGPDGYKDIMMKFRSQDIAAAVGAGTYGDIVLTLTGTYLDGIQFDAADCVVVVGKGYMPMEYTTVDEPTLKDAYPNPFNPTTRLTVLLPEASDVNLAIYDVAGRLVDVIVNGAREAGDHVIEWDAGNVASGVYFARLKAGNTTQVKRLILLK